jgi:hypothetical protein
MHCCSFRELSRRDRGDHGQAQFFVFASFWKGVDTLRSALNGEIALFKGCSEIPCFGGKESLV